MDNFLTSADFTGFEFLTDNSFSAQTTQIITDVQETVLKDLLGTNLYIEFSEAIEGGSPAQKWIDLRDGAVVTNSEGQKIDFKGVKSMLKYFTYFYIIRFLQLQQTSIGMSDYRIENASKVSINSIGSIEYNKGIEIYGYDWNIDFCDYQEVYQLNQFHAYAAGKILTNEKRKPTAYNFLKYSNDATTDTYADWIYTYKFKLNSFGL